MVRDEDADFFHCLCGEYCQHGSKPAEEVVLIVLHEILPASLTSGELFDEMAEQVGDEGGSEPMLSHPPEEFTDFGVHDLSFNSSGKEVRLLQDLFFDPWKFRIGSETNQIAVRLMGWKLMF